MRDAVYASCALPGYFPPGRVGDRLCVDGGVVDNLPVAHRRARRRSRSSPWTSAAPTCAPIQRRAVARLREHLHARRDDDDARAAAVSAHALERPADGARSGRASARIGSASPTSPARSRKGTAPRSRRSRTSTRFTISRAASIRAGASRSRSIATSASVAACASRSRRASMALDGAGQSVSRARAPSTGRRPTAISCTSARRARSPRERSSASCRLKSGERGAA